MLSDRLRELETQQDEITERLARAPIDIPDIHPNVADIYRRKVARLADALNHPEDSHEATAALRGLIERIVLTPGRKRGELHATLHGELGTIIEWVARTKPMRKETQSLRHHRVSRIVSLGACAGLTRASMQHAAFAPSLPSPACGGGSGAEGAWIAGSSPAMTKNMRE